MDIAHQINAQVKIPHKHKKNIFQTTTEGKSTKSELNKKSLINTEVPSFSKEQAEQGAVEREQFNVAENRRVPFRVRSVDVARISHCTTYNGSLPLQKIKENTKASNNRLAATNIFPKKLSKPNIAQSKDKMCLTKLEQRDIKKVIKK
jgi:hypothetical protein